MARYTASVETARERGEVSAYLSDFSTTREWDPGVSEAERLDDGPLGVGSRFRVVAGFLGRSAELTFTDTPAGGTRVAYDAVLGLRGPLRLLDPLLGLAFRRIGDAAAEGLRDRLAADRPALAASGR